MSMDKSSVQVLLAPTSATDNTTTTARLDCKNADKATILVNMAAEEGTDASDKTIKLTHSDTTTTTSNTVVATQAADLVNAHLHRIDVDCRKYKRYLTLSVTMPNATGNDGTFAALAVLERLDKVDSTSDYLGSTNDTYQSG